MARRRAGERFVKDAPYDVRDKDAEIRAATSYVPRKSSRNGCLLYTSKKPSPASTNDLSGRTEQKLLSTCLLYTSRCV